MKKLNHFVLVLLAGLVLLSASCSQENEVILDDQPTEISPELTQIFKDFGFDVKDIKTDDFTHPVTGKKEKHYILENDIRFSYEDLIAMQDEALPKTEQYRTTNLVTSTPRTIKIRGYQNGTSSATLDQTMVSGLQMAVANYNALGLNLTFSLTFGSSTTGQDIVVYRQVGGAGGSAGFPTGGNPYNSVYILSGTSGYGTDVMEHVMTHEIGHCVGLRHTDYFNRSISCGSGGDEGTAGVGAVHITGTPAKTNIDLNSIMLACFDANETGEFSNYDITALKTLYPGATSGCQLAVSKSSLSYRPGGGSQSITLTTGSSWTAVPDEPWITVTPSSGSTGGTITISVDDNPVLCDPRVGSVTITGCNNTVRTIMVYQDEYEPGGGFYCFNDDIITDLFKG